MTTVARTNNLYYGDYEEHLQGDGPGWQASAWQFLQKKLIAALGTNGVGHSMLSGNFAPVNKQTENVKLVSVAGSVPKGLNGAYARIGPNPAFAPAGGYHWFDGDGMIHAVKLEDESSTYSNQFVRTKKLQTELKHGRSVFVKIGDLIGLGGVLLLGLDNLQKILGVLPPGLTGTANTALVAHANRILALQEQDVPYTVRMLCSGIVETLGPLNSDKISMSALTAHPKIDPESKEMIYFSYCLQSQPYVKLGFLDRKGDLDRVVPINSLKRPVMVHDMAFTQTFVIVFDAPLVFDPSLMIKKGSFAFELRKELPVRFGLVPRDAEDDSYVRWFEVEGGAWISHTVNAWDDPEQNLVQLVSARLPDLDLGKLTVEAETKRTDTITLWTFDLKSGMGTQRRIVPEGVHGDFPVINQKYAGRRNQFFWFARTSTKWNLTFVGVEKIDLFLAQEDVNRGHVGSISLEDGECGGEFYFTPRNDNDCNRLDEDDGYLMGYVHNVDKNTSYFVIYDAQTMSSVPVYKAAVPSRIPYGFHGLYLPEKEFEAQLMQPAVV